MKRNWHVFISGMTLAALFVLADPNRLAACPNCKEAVSLQPGEQANVASGYNWSVMFMLVVPFSMMSTGAFMIRRAVKNGSLPEF